MSNNIELNNSLLLNRLNKNIETEVLIIGSGVSGLLNAYILSEEGINTLLIDHGFIDNNSTTSSTYELDGDLRFISSIIDKKDSLEAFKISLECIYKLDDITNHLEDKCDFIRKPSLHIKNVDKSYEYVFFNDQISKVDYTHNDDPIYDGLFSYNSKAEINPDKLSNGLLKYCNKQGINLYPNTNVVNIYNEEENLIVETDSGLKIKCLKIIYANDTKEIEKPINNVSYLGSNRILYSLLGARLFLNDYLHLNDESLKLFNYNNI